jgi:hypothetical protein
MATEVSLAMPAMKESVMHPAEVIQNNFAKSEHRAALHQIRCTQSWASAARRSFDQAVLLQGRRLGGLPTSDASYRHYNGTNCTVKVEDVYGLKKNCPKVQPRPRTLVEKAVYGEELTLVK